MSLSRIFLVIVAVTIGGAAILYYSSDYYAQRSSGAAEPAVEGSPPGERGAPADE